MQTFLTNCVGCRMKTSKKYANAHNGLCKRCAEPEECMARPYTPTREQRILEHGYQNYAREEGHYDGPDY